MARQRQDRRVLSPPEMPQPAPRAPQAFTTTHWSVVLAAGAAGEERAAAALESLCRAYWYPVYAYVRRRGHEALLAEDLTQEFFCRLLGKHYLAQVDPGKGRFRSFLMVAINHFLSNERDRRRTAKRGGGVALVSLDAMCGEDRYRLEPATAVSPETLFEQRWAIAMLEQVLARLRAEFADAGEGELFDALKQHLAGAREAPSYASQAARLGRTEAALKMAVTRLRRRYAELLRAEIARTVSQPEEVDDELRHLFAALRGP